jgi:molybdopterin synthase sulfur carrier subunit
MGEATANGIRIRLFAGLREQAGWAEQHWPLNAASEPPLTPQQLWEALELPGPLSQVRIAINQQFADSQTPLHPGDELAFLPPISGG